MLYRTGVKTKIFQVKPYLGILLILFYNIKLILIMELTSTKTMGKADIVNVITEAVNACGDETGWANLAEVGAYLRKAGIKYGKLSRFLSDYQQIVETKQDTSITPPAVYAKLIA